MKKIRITAIRKACYPDLMAKYENPIQHACDVAEGQVWIADGWAKPEGFCDSAWDSISPFVMTLAHGGGNFYDGWMKDPKTAMISCNDGFRPVSFYIEALEEDAEKILHITEERYEKETHLDSGHSGCPDPDRHPHWPWHHLKRRPPGGVCGQLRLLRILSLKLR